MRKIIPVIMTADFIYLLSLCTSLEIDYISIQQFIIRCIIATAIFITLDYIQSTKIKAFRSGNCKKAKRK